MKTRSKISWYLSRLGVLYKSLVFLAISLISVVAAAIEAPAALDAKAFLESAEAKKEPVNLVKIAMVSEVPVDSYDPAKCDESIGLAWRQMLTSLVGEKAIKSEPKLQEALDHPRFYVAQFGFLTRARKPSRPMQLKSLESDLVAREAEADLYLRIRWNVPAVKALTADWLAANAMSLSLTSEADAPTNLEAKSPRSMLVWLNCRGGDGNYHLLQNRLEPEDIVLLDILRKGAKSTGLELLLPLVDATDHEQLSNIDWAARRSESNILELSKPYNADFILSGSLKKRLLGGWQGEWMLWDGKKWQNFQVNAPDRPQALAALLKWVALQPTLQQDAASEKEATVATETLTVRLRIAKIKNFEDSRKVMAYLRNLSPLIHNIELATLKADSIELDLNFNGSKEQLESLLQGEYGVVLDKNATGPAKRLLQEARDSFEDIDLILNALWIEA